MNNLNAILAIAFRDITKLLRDRTRIVASLIFPALFIGVLGTSMQANLQEALPYDFLTFVFTGVIAQVLFQSTASGMVSLIEDRENDFAQELFIAPVSRYAIIFGKIVGETMVALMQVTVAIIFSLIIGVQFNFATLITVLPVMLVIALFGGAFGVLVMSQVSDQKTVNQLFPFLLFPQYFLAGVFNPIQDLPLPLKIASRLAPMTYAVDLMRSVYYQGKEVYQYVVLFRPGLNLLVVGLGTIVFLVVGTWLFVKNERNR